MTSRTPELPQPPPYDAECLAWQAHRRELSTPWGTYAIGQWVPGVDVLEHFPHLVRHGFLAPTCIQLVDGQFVQSPAEFIRVSDPWTADDTQVGDVVPGLRDRGGGWDLRAYLKARLMRVASPAEVSRWRDRQRAAGKDVSVPTAQREDLLPFEVDVPLDLWARSVLTWSLPPFARPPTWFQPPAPPPAPAEPAPATPTVDELQRANLELSQRVSQLERQAASKAAKRPAAVAP
jgi:hypothetical protein